MLRACVAILPFLSYALADECLSYGMAYEGHQVIVAVPTISAEHCQSQCVNTFACAFFTWRVGPNYTANPPLMQGDCKKYNDQATLVAVEGIANHTVSGPRECAGGTTTTGLGAPTVAPLPTLAPLPPVGTPAMDIINTTFAPVNGTNCTGGFCVAEGSEGGGFPWWAILLIVLVVLGVAAAVIYGSCADGGKKKKKKDKGKKSKKEMSTFADESGEGEALVVEAPAVPMAAPAEAPAASPVATSSPAVVAPATSLVQPQQMVYTSGGQVIVQQPAPGVPLQMPLMSGGVRQLQIR